MAMIIKKRKIFVIDLDGTFLNDSKMISSGLWDICKELAEEDYYILIATGRAPSDTIQYYRILDLDTILINYNGGLIWKPNTAQKYASIYLNNTPSIFTYLLENFQTIGIQNVLACSDEKCYFYNEENPYLIELMKSVDLRFEVIGKQIFGLSNCQRIIISLADEKLIDKWTLVFRYLFRDIDIFKWSNAKNIIDISLPRRSVSKWKALKSLLETDKNYFIFSVGDSSNDIEMLENSTVGVAMANADIEVKSIANYVTRFDNNNDGLSDFMRNNERIWKNIILK